METEKTTYGKVTIYMEGAFGYTKTEAKGFEHWRTEYAQYKSAIRFRYLEPRKRKWKGGTMTNKPTLVVLEGWGHMDPDDPMTEERADGIFTVKSTRYACFDPRYAEEFGLKLAAYMGTSGATVLEDFRGVSTHCAAA